MKNDSIGPTLIIGAGVVLALLAWKFSNALNLPFEIGFNILIFSVALSMGYVVMKFLVRFEPTIWPIFMVLFYWCWFPAFDHWSYVENSFSSYFRSEQVSWYALWYVQALLSIVILFGGYAIDKLIKKWVTSLLYEY